MAVPALAFAQRHEHAQQAPRGFVARMQVAGRGLRHVLLGRPKPSAAEAFANAIRSAEQANAEIVGVDGGSGLLTALPAVYPDARHKILDVECQYICIDIIRASSHT